MGNEEMKEIFRDFDALAVRERMDAFVALADKWKALERQGGPVKVSSASPAHLTIEDRIVETAEALGVELHEHKPVSGSGPFLYWFHYKGYKFYHLSGERLERNI